MFFENILKVSEQIKGHRIIVGDYNVALNKTLDRNTSNSLNPKSAAFLNEYFENNELIDVWRSRNPNRKHFTWKRDKPTKVASRLDMIVAEADVVPWFKYINIKKSYRTDHMMVEAEIQSSTCKRGRGLWRLNIRHLSNYQFVNWMNQKLDEQINTFQYSNKSPADKWEHLKLTLIRYSQEFSNKLAAQKNLIEGQLEDEICKLNEKLERTEGEEKILEWSIADLDELIAAKAQGAIFRSRAQWFNEGEHNTKYFFSLEKVRSGEKNISVLLDQNKKEIRDQKEILEQMRTFYSELYKSDPSINFKEENISETYISPETSQKLEGELQYKEVTEAIKQLNQNKAPGTDGLPIEIYIMFWRKIGEYLVNALNHAYKVGKLHDSALDGVISLIPKPNKDTKEIKNLRPITLLNTDYKILEKCLANRLKSSLEELINEDQKGFMANRRIGVNIRRILDAVEFCEKTDKPIVILSIDAEKAFDRIEIDSLLKSMEYFKIGQSFRKWTKLCFTGARACVINNGITSKRFPVTRGVKQGGCCSAFYFLLLIETLANKLRNTGDLEGIDINGIIKLLGQYADDLDMYLWGNRQNVKKAINTIKEFEKSSGMKININKSTIFKLGQIRDVDLQLGIKEVSKINVLGVEVINYIDEGEIFKLNYEKTINRAQAILNQWSTRGLSLLGKVLVINTLIASLFVYKMTVLPPFPDKYVKQMNDMMNRFLWNNKKPKIKLEILQLSKKHGGAGLVNFERKDISLKFAWVKTIMSDSFIENNAYYQLSKTLRENIWTCNLAPSDFSLLNIQSHFWRSVLIAWSELNYVKHVPPDEFMYQTIWFNSHIRKEGKPFLCKIAYDNGLSQIFQLFNDMGELRTAADIAAEFHVPILQINTILAALPKEWRKIGPINEEADENNLYTKIKSLNKPTAYAYRAITARHSAIGHCYHKWTKLLPEIELETIEDAFKTLYKCTNYTKLRSFQFRFIHKALVMNTQLYKWKITSNDLCCNCNKKPETVLHFFCECEVARKLWLDVKLHVLGKYGAPLQTDIVSILFGNKDLTDLQNLIYIAVKCLMYTARCKKERINVLKIDNFINQCQKYERHNAFRTNKVAVYEKKWALESDLNEYIAQYITEGVTCHDG